MKDDWAKSITDAIGLALLAANAAILLGFVMMLLSPHPWPYPFEYMAIAWGW